MRVCFAGLLLVVMGLNPLHQSKQKMPRSMCCSTFYSITDGGRMAVSTLPSRRATMPVITLFCQNLKFPKPRGFYGHIDGSNNLLELQFYHLFTNLWAYFLFPGSFLLHHKYGAISIPCYCIWVYASYIGFDSPSLLAMAP